MTALLQLTAAAPDFWSGLTDGFSQWLHSISHLSHTLAHGYGTASQAAASALSQVVEGFTSPLLWRSVLYWGLILVMLVGVAGAFIPALPGITLIVAAIAVWGFVNGFAGLWLALGVAIAALVLGIVADYLAGILGAQRVGASSWGQIGAVVGMLLGLFGLLPALPVGGPILGLVFGTVLGAFVGEFLHRRELPVPKRMQQSFKVGIAIVVGNLVGNLVQGLLAVFTIVVFIVTTWSSLYGS